MRAMDMTADQRATALSRHKRADEIMGDYERQYGLTLPVPWRETIPGLLLQGMGDPELHNVFTAIARVEFDAGRLPEMPPDFSSFDE